MLMQPNTQTKTSGITKLVYCLKYGRNYWRMHQVKFVKAAFHKLYLVHS